ncbi:hypothetical protein APB23_35250 [Pseudomonas aeruginosa]|nr:hypothetical protein APA89_35305 [Pseudomonas aeruginosa]OPE28850.1 hypothetical protein APB23_35250 [Pseudomonas aeruginosa]OPE32214.1 hypothetical protein APB25_36480 [Pseudomonas aeruginosa]OPE42983.1 hypothetical protein APB75_34250 [Pseudomonas aeruginosa]
MSAKHAQASRFLQQSLSAPTFAEPDQGPLAGGRKVNARHDLTLGLWRRDCEISRGFPRR